MLKYLYFLYGQRLSYANEEQYVLVEVHLQE